VTRATKWKYAVLALIGVAWMSPLRTPHEIQDDARVALARELCFVMTTSLRAYPHGNAATHRRLVGIATFLPTVAAKSAEDRAAWLAIADAYVAQTGLDPMDHVRIGTLEAIRLSLGAPASAARVADEWSFLPCRSKPPFVLDVVWQWQRRVDLRKALRKALGVP